MQKYKMVWFDENDNELGRKYFEAEFEHDASTFASGILRYEYHAYHTLDVVEDVVDMDFSAYWVELDNIKDELTNDSLWTKEVAKEIRQNLKRLFGKGYKFSVRMETFAGGSSISVSLLQAPVQVIMEGEDNYIQLNQFYPESEHRLTANGREIVTLMHKVALLRHWDDSDIQSDYFNCNYYYHGEVGKWGKPFTVS